MRFSRSILIIAFITITSPSLAQQDMLPPEPLENDIRELLDVTHVEKLGDQMLGQIFYAYERMMPNVPVEIWEKARKEMRASDMVELVIPIYAKHFNREDIRGLIDFFKSPIGKKFIDKQEMIMKESMVIGIAWGQEVSKKIESELKLKGYKVPNKI